ncbi:MAG: leucine-rich repeat domain-containing protein [Treponemataceae bacterium]|nr:leucine-rich repeat domain-containing protein [Treponemataceae bacterium]
MQDGAVYKIKLSDTNALSKIKEKNSCLFNLDCTGIIGNFSDDLAGTANIASIDFSGSSISSFDPGAFTSCTGLTSVKLPAGVITLGENLFKGCTNLTAVSNLNTLSDGIFDGCTSLTSVSMTGITSIPKEAFKGSAISISSLPSGITSIGESAFADTNITSITLPNTVTSIGANAFENTAITSITIPNSNITIGADAFKGCNLVNLTISPTAAINSGSSAFATNSNLKVTVPSGTTIAANAFKDWTSIGEIVLPGTITTLNSSAFEGCTALRTINLEDTKITSLSQNLFKDCSSLEELTLPDTVYSYGYECLAGSGITELVIPKTPPSKSFTSNDYCLANSNITKLTVDANSISSIGGIIRNSNVTTLVLQANLGTGGKITNQIVNATKLTSVTFDSSVTSIPDNMLKGCTNLTTLVIPASVKEIGQDAFLNTNITDLTVGGTNSWTDTVANISGFTLYADSINKLYIMRGSIDSYTGQKFNRP